MKHPNILQASSKVGPGLWSLCPTSTHLVIEGCINISKQNTSMFIEWTFLASGFYPSLYSMFSDKTLKLEMIGSTMDSVPNMKARKNLKRTWSLTLPCLVWHLEPQKIETLHVQTLCMDLQDLILPLKIHSFRKLHFCKIYTCTFKTNIALKPCNWKKLCKRWMFHCCLTFWK